MRKKILHFLSLTGFEIGPITDQLVEQIVGGLRIDFESSLGEHLPPAAIQILAAFETSLRERQGDFLDRVISTLGEHLDEANLDLAIAFYESPAGKLLASKATSVQETLMEAQTEWRDAALKNIEPDLEKLLGAINDDIIPPPSESGVVGEPPPRTA